MRSAIPVVEPAAVAYPTSTRVASPSGDRAARTRVDEGPMTPEVGTEVAAVAPVPTGPVAGT